ncbi:MAG: 4-vinyl reductase [Chloroflexota bacterium]
MHETAAAFPPRLLKTFIETLASELGADNLMTVLDKASLPASWADLEAVARFDAAAAGRAYAGLQQAVRTVYGRGARGILLRVGNELWRRLLDDGGLGVKAQAALVKGLPARAARKPALDLLAKLLSSKPGDITVHTLDLDLLFVDHTAPSANGQRGGEPICWVTLGLIREALHWATGRDYDITEISCRALGDQTCEFKIQ